MSELADTQALSLSQAQLSLIARKSGVYSGRSFVDIGTGDGAWVRSLAKGGLPVRGMEERKRTTAIADEVLAIGSPAAAVPYAAHSVETILFRGTSLFDAPAFGPELMIALANLGSSLKPRGALLIPVKGDIVQEQARWEEQLNVFPGRVKLKSFKTGLLEFLNLSFLWNGTARVELLEFRVNRLVESRLEWHRLAREAVLRRMQAPAAA